MGRLIHDRQQEEGWGASIIPRLARDIVNELPEVRGFSERNLKRMLRFYREYCIDAGELQTDSVADLKVPQPVALIPWGHNAVLLEKVKDRSVRLWYAEQTYNQGWSRATLQQMIRNRAHERQGKAVTNFDQRLPLYQSELAQQHLKDPYIFDFLTIDQPFRERELEVGLLEHLEAFLIELGNGVRLRGAPISIGRQ